MAMVLGLMNNASAGVAVGAAFGDQREHLRLARGEAKFIGLARAAPRTSADRPAATMSIQAVPRSRGGTISSHSMTTPLPREGRTPSVRVACQRPLLSPIRSTGRA
jgi:hypothetical protein